MQAAVLPVAASLHLAANAMMLMIVGVCRCDCAGQCNYGRERERCFLSHRTFERNGGWAFCEGGTTIH
ncbi:hypothetical protein A6V37_37325 [Paraburkholderia ginsengiterrae]|uniref:Secreted protein n=1 Tax=Paraburkholderia ginsengiterrae TaxID=1462993 RepID=A0A1A9MXB7_9BURK|nr:hypothetical protein A6V37_37325 [Paraburkholderia ginsengiterrae]